MNSTIRIYVIKLIPHKETPSSLNLGFYAGLKPLRQLLAGAI